MSPCQSNDVYYRTFLATTVEPLIRWRQLCNIKHCKLQVLSNKCCLDFIGQSINEIIHLASFRHCLRPSKWRNVQPYDKLIYSSEPSFDAESKLYTQFIVAQRTRELHPDFTSIPPLPQFEKLKAPNFRLNKDNMTDKSPHANSLGPAVLPRLLDVKISTWTENLASYLDTCLTTNK